MSPSILRQPPESDEHSTEKFGAQFEYVDTLLESCKLQ